MVTAVGMSVAMLGTPVPLVTSTPLLAVARPATVLAAEEESNWLMGGGSGKGAVEARKFVPSERRSWPAVPAVAGYVAVDHAGAPAPPERSTCPLLPAASMAVVAAAL